jgi:hypothetical protein
MRPIAHVAAQRRGYDYGDFLARLQVGDKPLGIIVVVPRVVSAAPHAFTADDALVAVDMDNAFPVLNNRNISFVAGTLGYAKIAADALFVSKDLVARHVPTPMLLLCGTHTLI